MVAAEVFPVVYGWKRQSNSWVLIASLRDESRNLISKADGCLYIILGLNKTPGPDYSFFFTSLHSKAFHDIIPKSPKCTPHAGTDLQKSLQAFCRKTEGL